MAWVFYNPIEKRLKGYDNRNWDKVALLLRWLPPTQVLIMILYRSQAIISRNMSHNEIARYLGVGNFSSQDFKLLFTGDGGIEIMAFLALTFAIISDKLPSLKDVRKELKTAFRNRIMLFSALFLLTSSAFLFPEDAYSKYDLLPTQPVGDVPEWSAFIIVGLIFGLVMFNGELFAITTLFLSGKTFDKLSIRAQSKVLLLSVFSLIFLASQFDFNKTGVQQLIEGDLALPLTLLIHLGFCFAFILQPSVRFDAELNHGENRSAGILILSAAFGLITIVLTSLHLNALEVFGTHLGPYTFGMWIATVTITATMVVQFLPTLGFDAAPRPEMWWMKMTFVFAPIFISMFTPFALYLIPAIWIALPWSSLAPWVIEKDSPSPSRSFVLIPFLITTVACSIVPFLSSKPLFAALTIGWIPGAIASIGLMLHVRNIQATEK